MLLWVEACLIAAAIVSIITIIILVITIRRRIALNQQIPATTTATTTSATEQAWTHTERRSSYQHIFRRVGGGGGGGGFTKRFFNWDDHPSLITDAVENGWSRFAFTSSGQAPPARPSLFGSLRVGGEYYSNPVVEESWVIGSGSVDYMQKLKFKSMMMMMIINGGTIGVKSTVRMGLPLPGPPPSFPQEAYFEISVVDSGEGGNGEGGISEGEKTKLLMKQQQQGYRKSSSTTAIGNNNLSVVNGGAHQLIEELRHGGRRGGGGGGKVTIGLSVGGFSNGRVPGSYPGSIGFNSDGSVFLGGMKLVFESEKEDWAKPGKIIGCGFDPRKKKVYFTVNSELAHVINCKSEDFGMPLYPLITTSIDITLLVNLGQSSFNYSPSNATRTPNPCFIGLDVNSPRAAALDYEDSQELFSMGRLDDTEWLSHSATTKSTISISSDTNNNRNYGKMEVGEEELEGGDFFEITLDFRKEAKVCL